MITQGLLLTIALSPLFGALVAGFFGNVVGRRGAHFITILGVAVSCGLSLYVYQLLASNGAATYNQNVYTWFSVGELSAHVGFLVDRLSAVMMVVVTFVSLMVHIYTIGYMKDDAGYQRFFAYISLFTFSMLMLVMSNNMLQLFFGWEAVGLVSYLLIGFWHTRPSAVFANMKAFLVNRVGDLGFLLGIALVLFYCGSLDYREIFASAPSKMSSASIELISGWVWSAPTVACILLFIGAMGKSAQVPLHVWLPDSMEGPTPISALIHAATMVTAGIFMVSRMSPLFEMSDTALSFILVIGAVTALFMGLIGIVQNDIKRVVAYSTLSQLGYMTVALGASAYSAAIFHLMTHAFFKALLFLGAGSVIIALHHEQDLRRMGGLRRYLPITFVTAWIGTLALIGFPGTSGFYSKDAIIEAVRHSERAGAGFAYLAVLAGVFVTSFYSFRLLYLAFHGSERLSDQQHGTATEGLHAHSALATSHADASTVISTINHHADADSSHGAEEHHAPHEPGLVVTLPLVLLAIPSLVVGWFLAKPILADGFFGEAIVVAEKNRAATEVLAHHLEHGPTAFALHGFAGLPFWLALAGFASATFLYWKLPFKPERERGFLGPLYNVLDNKYYFDQLYQAVFARGSVRLGKRLWAVGDQGIIDGIIVNGSASLVGRVAQITRRLQTGYLYQYAFTMIIGLILMIAAFVIYR